MRVLPLLLILFTPGFSEAEDPFPANRVRDFYRNQAEKLLDQEGPVPKLLPQFPGLDGGAWGHWGQNPESDNTDTRLGEVDTGGMLMQVTRFKGGEATKGVNVRVGKYTALFDPEKLTFVAAWEGSWVTWASRRYGITSGVSAGGAPIRGTMGSKWILPEKVEGRYLGLFRGDERIVFHYTIGDTVLYDSLIVGGDGGLVREITADGKLPDGAQLTGGLEPEYNLEPKLAAKPGTPRWTSDAVVTKGELGEANGAYAIDTITIPYRDQNPFKTPMRIGGVGIMPDGKVAVCTLMGDVWLVDGVDEDLDELTWRRFASGLHQPLGLVISEDKVHVIGRDQLTRLHDANGDGEADYYECLTNQFPTSKGNNFALTLHTDEKGRFYWFTRSDGFGMTRYTPGGATESIATGLRGANGTGVSPDGKIVLVAPQEGTWQPASSIFEVGDHSYHGFSGPRPKHGKYGYDLPLCFIPRGIDNSSGDLIFLPEDQRFGPLAGRIVGTSFGYCQHYLVLREEIGGGVQGGVVPLPGEFLSGAHRMSFSQRDGNLYVAGSDGWQSYARENGSLQRLRYTGGEMHLPTSVETRENGLIVHFNTELDPGSVRLERTFCEQWNYLYSGTYGSPEYSVKNPGTQGHDLVQVRSIHLLEDRRSVFVEIPQLHPVMQFHLYTELRAADGTKFSPDIYYSIFKLGEPFENFTGYEPVKKDPWNDFPQPGENPVDPRLLKQETLAKVVGDETVLAAIEKREIATIAGLKFDKEKLVVKAGARVALTVTNADPSMPHNFVLVRPSSLEAVGLGSMKLATSPEGLSKHYVIEDAGVIALSPILQPGGSYIVYFDAPGEPGNYPYICTFPGHWQVTKGILTVKE